MAETLSPLIRNWKGPLIGKTSPRASIFSVDMFWSFGNIEFWRKAEYRLGRCWGHDKILNFQLVLMNRLNITESAVFIYCRFSLFLKDPFFPDYLVVKVYRSVGGRQCFILFIFNP